jgi:hypothetical protein
MQLFARITKVDAIKRQITGILVQECLDRSGEIFDYDTSKAHFVAWSDGIHKATEGKSVGNMRVMHGNHVAGKFSSIEFNDAEKSIEVVGDVIDDNEWKKCEAGCYTGLSIGGRYEKKWDDPTDPTVKRYTAIPSEGSLVDLPCVPTAQFKMVKADGSDEMRKFVTATDTPVEKTYKLGNVEVSESYMRENGYLTATTPVEKGMGHVAQLAGLLQSIGYLTQDQYDEAAREGDGSTVPAGLEAWLQTGAALLCSMTVEETAEIVAESTDPQTEDVPVLALAAGDELGKADDTELEKVGAKHSKSTIDHHAQIAKHAQGILDHVSTLAGQVPKQDGKATKAADDQLTQGTDMTDTIEKAASDLAKLTTDRDDALAKVATLTAELDALKAKPVPVKAAALAVSKSDDTTAPDPVADLRKQVDELADGPDKVRAMIKLAYQSPR